MALSQEIINESELAKSYITNSDFDDNYKKSLLNLVNLTTLSTNGISPEEKIQKMTEAIHLLAITQVSFITKVDEKIERSIQNANMRQCQNCKAMKHAVESEEEKKKLEIIRQYEIENGIDKANKVKETQSETCGMVETGEMTWSQTFKNVMMKPFFWIWSSVVVFSPFGCEIIKMILDHFTK